MTASLLACAAMSSTSSAGGRTGDTVARAHGRRSPTLPRAVERLGSSEVFWAVASGIAAIIAAIGAMRAWRSDFGIPFWSDGDALGHQMAIKGMLEHGWVLTNPDMGAPFGQDLYDFPLWSIAALPTLVMKTLGIFLAGVGPVVNAYYLLTFGLSAFTAFLVLRWFGVSRPPSAVLSILFALVPYGLAHAELHLTAVSFYTVPLSAYLLLSIIRGDALFAWRAGGPAALRWASRRTLTTLALCVLIALTDVYYLAFTVVLVAVTSLVVSIGARSWVALRSGAAIVLAIVAVAGLAATPVIAYRISNGGNSEATQRKPEDSVQNSTNITQLVLPAEGYPIKSLDRIQEKYRQGAILFQEQTPIGLIASIGLFWLGLVALVALATAGRGPAIADNRQKHLSALTIATLVFATTGGLSALIAYTISPMIRDWGRIAPFIAFFALAAVGLLLDRGYRRASGRWRVPMLGFVAALAALLVVGFFDQATKRAIPLYDQTNAAWRSDERIVRQIERVLANDAMVFQLPYAPFPESPTIGGMVDFSQARPYLHSERLRWSYGAMRGRPADWSAALDSRPLERVVAQVSAAGFQGLLIDRSGYADLGKAVEQRLAGIVGAPPSFVSPNGRMSFFDLRPFDARLRRRLSPAQIQAVSLSTLKPVRVEYSDAFGDREVGPDATWRWSESPSGRITLHNPLSRPRRTRVSMVISRQPGLVNVRYPDGTSQAVTITPKGPVPITREVILPPGESSLELSTPSGKFYAPGDPRTLYFQVNSLQLTDPLWRRLHPSANRAAWRLDTAGLKPSATTPHRVASTSGRSSAV